MAEFTFYGVWEDSIAILDQLIQSCRFTFIIDKPYEEPKEYTFTSLNENVECVLFKTPIMYLKSDQYSIFPPYFSKSTTNLWRIFPLRSGPFLNLDLPQIQRTIDKIILGKGWLIYQSKYWHPETLEYYSPPEALRDAFNFVKKIIIQNCVKRYIPFQYFTTQGAEKYQVRTLYIGRFGIELVREEGFYINIGGEGLLTYDDLFNRRVDVEKQIEQIRSQ